MLLTLACHNGQHARCPGTAEFDDEANRRPTDCECPCHIGSDADTVVPTSEGDRPAEPGNDLAAMTTKEEEA